MHTQPARQQHMNHSKSLTLTPGPLKPQRLGIVLFHLNCLRSYQYFVLFHKPAAPIQAPWKH